MNDQSPTAEPADHKPLMLSAKALALELDMGERTVRRLDDAGLLPEPRRIGRNLRWPTVEIVAWIKAGCPNRQTWAAMNQPEQMHG